VNNFVKRNNFNSFVSTKRYTPDTIRTVVAQEAHDYYSAHGFPLGYGSVPVRSRKRRWRKMVGGATTTTTATTPSPSPSPIRDDEFMNEETYSFELMDDDDDVMDGVGGLMRSMEDEWRFEDDEFMFEDDEDDDEEDYDDLYEDDEDDDDDDVVEGDDDRTGNGKKKKDVTFIGGEDQDAEGEMEIDIEPFQDPSFNPDLSSSKSKSEPQQSFVSSFYIPHIRQEEEAPLPLAPSSLDGTPISIAFDTTNNDDNTPMQIHLPPAATIDTTNQQYHHYHNSQHNHQQQQLQLLPFSSNILPLPPPRLDSVRVFILRQSEMGGLKTSGRGTPADRKRAAIWGGGRVLLHQVGGGGREVAGKRGLDDDESDDGSDDGDIEGGEEDDESDEGEGGTQRRRPRLRLMLSDHDDGREEDGAKTSLGLGLVDADDHSDERMRPAAAAVGCEHHISESLASNDQNNHSTIIHKPSSSSTTTTSTTTMTTFVETDHQTWDAFLASLDDSNSNKNHHHSHQQARPQQQGEEGTTFDSSVAAADDNGQLLLDVDDGPNPHHRLHRERDPTTAAAAVTCRLGPSMSPIAAATASLEGSSGMFMFDHRQGGDDDEDDDDTSTSAWFGDGGGRSGSGSGSSGHLLGGVGVGVVGSSGTCPSDALAAMEGFSFPVGPDGTNTLSYALG
jgi:hypothetical protein